MVGSIYGVNSINSIYGINNIYGVNTYRNYLSSLANRQTNAFSGLMASAAAYGAFSNVSSGSTQSSSSSSLSQLNKSLLSMYATNAAMTLSKRTVVSSNSSAISGTAKTNAAAKSYSLNVSKLAAGQVNKGTELAAGDKSVFSKGMNTISISTGTTQKNVSFIINESDTNKTALNKLAAAVNNSGANVKATVETGKDDKLSLRLESAETGTRNAFALSDKQGNSVSAAGLNTVEIKAQNAVYSVDGRQYVSSSNNVNLDNGKVTVTLKKADNTDVELNVLPDTNSSALPDFYTYYNSLLSAGNYYNSGFNSGTLLDMFL